MCAPTDYKYIIRALEELAGDPDNYGVSLGAPVGVVLNYPTIERATMAAAAEAMRALVAENVELRGRPYADDEE